MNKAIFGILAALFLVTGAIAVSAEIPSTIVGSIDGRVASTGSPSTKIISGEGYLMPTGRFLAFTPIEQYRLVDKAYTENTAGSWYGSLGYGYLNDYDSYGQYLAVKNGEEGITSLGSSVRTEFKPLEPDPTHTPKIGNCVQWVAN